MNASHWWHFSTSSARLYRKCNNNVFDHSVSYIEIFSTMNMCLLVKYELSAEPLSVLYYYLIDVVMEMFNPAGAIIA